MNTLTVVRAGETAFQTLFCKGSLLCVLAGSLSASGQLVTPFGQTNKTAVLSTESVPVLFLKFSSSFNRPDAALRASGYYAETLILSVLPCNLSNASEEEWASGTLTSNSSFQEAALSINMSRLNGGLLGVFSSSAPALEEPDYYSASERSKFQAHDFLQRDHPLPSSNSFSSACAESFSDEAPMAENKAAPALLITLR